MALHFISDLHLDPERPEISALFCAYLAGPARQAQALYILGDLFEVWADDDVSAPLYRKEIQALRQLSEHGVAVYFLCGNRDFLCGDAFARSAGLQILREPHTIASHPQISLMHGDALCTDDKGYQRFRRIVRLAWLQWLYRRLPAGLKLRIAAKIRGSSAQMTRQKAQDILDVNEVAVQAFFRHHPHCRHLIHGHTHRPADHAVGPDQWRIVLSDWSEQAGEYLSVTQDGWQRHRLEPTQGPSQ